MLKNRTHIPYSLLILSIAAAVGVPSPPAAAALDAPASPSARSSLGFALSGRSIYSNRELGAAQRPLAMTDTTAPSVPSGLIVAGTQTSLTLTWLPSTDNVGVTGYALYLDGKSAGSTAVPTATFGGLACGTAHQFQVRAYDAAGNRSAKATISGSTSACPAAADTQAPTVPSGLQVSSTTGSLTLTWQPSTDNVGVTGYALYLDGGSAGSTTVPSATFGGLACGTAHQLQVRAYDAAGNRSAKATISGSTSACPAAADTQTPSVPSGLKVSSARNSLTLTWQPSTDNVGVTAYGLYRDGIKFGLTATTSATFGGLACGTAHQLQVRAWDAAGNPSAKATISGSTAPCAPGPGPGPGPTRDTKAPTVPSGLKVSRAKTSLTLTWQRSTDNVGVKAYGLYLDGKQKGAVAKTAATLGGLACNTAHKLQVDAVDAAGNRSAKASIAARTTACGATPPPPAGGGATTFVSPNGSDKNACTQAAPCASFGRAHRATRCGGTVRIAPGSYGRQDIAPDPAKASCTQRVILDASGGAALTLGMRVAAAHVEVVGIRGDLSGCVTTKIAPPCPALAIAGGGDVVARSVHFSRFYVYTQNVQILGSNFGPSYDNHGIVGAPTRNLLVADTVIHDQWNSQACKSSPGCFGANHMGCGTINDSANVTFARNRIYNCQDLAVLVKPYLGSNTNIRFENNVLGPVGGARAVSLTATNSASHQNSGIHFINNTFPSGQAFTVSPGVAYPNSTAIGNLGYLGLCGAFQRAGFAVDYNVSLGNACGPHSRGVSTLGLAPDGIHLVAGSPAFGAGHPGNHPANDIDGQARPPSGPIDAGADQH